MYFSNILLPDGQIIVETKYSLVLTNLRPFLKHHLMVIPKRVVERISGLEKEEYEDLMLLAKRTEKVLLNFESTVLINLQDGKPAGQTVPHVHYHLIPRNDSEDSKTPIDIDIKRKDRTAKEMEDEASFLRPFFENE